MALLYDIYTNTFFFFIWLFMPMLLSMLTLQQQRQEQLHFQYPSCSMESTCYLPKHECQFMHSVRDELEIYQTQTVLTRWEYNYWLCCVKNMHYTSIFVVVYLFFAWPVCWCSRLCPAGCGTWSTITWRNFQTSAPSLWGRTPVAGWWSVTLSSGAE